MRRRRQRILAGIWFLILAFPIGATGQDMHPFTYDELYQASKLVMSDSEAARFAAELAPGASVETLGEARSSGALSFRTVGHSDLLEDTLVLLSLLSAETQRKVERYRLQLYSGRIPSEEDARWRERVEQLRQWARAGFPKDT